MTEPVFGSSLPQARDQQPHTHYRFHAGSSRHSHDHKRHQHQHYYHHARSEARKNTQHKRNDSEPTTIVETISVLQLVDATGGVITIETLPTSQPTSQPTSTQPTPTITTGSESEPTTVTTGSGSESESESQSQSQSQSPSQSPSQPQSESESESLPASQSASPSTPASASTPTSSAPAPTTTTTDQDTGGVTPLPSSSSAAPGTSVDNGGGDTSLSSSSLEPTIDPTVAPSGISMPTTFPTLSYSPVTSTPLSPAPAFPSLPGISNTTFQSTSSSLSTTTTSNSTTTSSQLFTSSGASSLSDFVSSISVSSTGSTSITNFTSSTSTSVFSSETSTTTGGGGYSGSGEDDGSAAPTSTSAADDGSGSSDGPSVATVAGSVLGAVAGIAFILVIALVVLRWKKRQNALKQGGSAGDQGARALPEGNSGPGGGGDMAEQRTGPFAVPAALASLSGYKRFSKSTASSDGGEKGFSKVSGRKLPPVIQFGGDGYTDPRATIMSDQSIEYRDSQNILGNPSPSRLAVGTPMRPDSGVPVFHAGPARTPVTASNPFSSYEDNSPLEPPGRDPLGRSHPSHDGSNQSRGSGSRFTENL